MLCFGLGISLFAAATSSAKAQLPHEAPLQANARIDFVDTPRRSAGPNVFGTIALQAGTTPMSARWSRVLRAPVARVALIRFTARAMQLLPQQQVSFVNAAVNRAVRSRSGAHCLLDDGYWAAANETLAKGEGDCIDIAIAKMEALRLLGFSVGNLYLTMGRVGDSDLEVALLVRVGDTIWLLDDHSKEIVEAHDPAAFEPAVTYGLGTTWAHGRLVKTVPPNSDGTVKAH